MASIALMGLLTGFAKGASERIEKEREENEELITTRLKLAAVNKQKREAEVAAKKTALTERFSSISPYLTGQESEEEKLALISNEAITKDFIDRRGKGETLDLNSYLVTKKDKIPKNFESVQKYIDTISAAPAAVSPEQMSAALGQDRGFFSAGVRQGRAEKIARTVGGGASAAELLAYEGVGPSTTEPLMEIARINAELYPKDVKKPEEQLQHIQGKVIQFSRQFGEDDDRTKRAREELAATEAAIDTLTEEQRNWSKRRNTLVAIIASPDTTVAAKNKAEVELFRGDGVDKNMLSPSDLYKFAQTAGTNAVSRKYGNLLDKSIAVTANPDGSSSYKYIGDPGEDIKKEIDKAYANAVRSAASRYVDPVTGRYINDAYKTAIDSLLAGIGTAPASPVPSPNAAAQPATRVAAPDAPSSSPPPAASGLGSRTYPPIPPNIALERENAQKAIAEGKDPEAVKKRFKERTGRDF
jgi:hypothetical protein